LIGSAPGEVFFQKHIGPEAPDAIRRFELEGGSVPQIYPYIEELPGFVALVQMNVVEIHPWGSTIKQLNKPDRVTFDLDPDEGLPSLNSAVCWPSTFRTLARSTRRDVGRVHQRIT
jgi:DNA primase